MKAINKRLLSFVIVLAMVLSMAPVISMPVAAAAPTGDYAFNSDWAPDADGYAWCQACYEQAKAAKGSELTQEEAIAAAWKQWVAFTGGNAASNRHYYLTESYTDPTNGTARFMNLDNDEAVCLNLNGHSVTMGNDTSRSMIRVYGDDSVLNIMDAKGTGVLAGYEDQNANAGAVIELRNGNPTCNIYGGIFRLADGASEKPVIGVYSATAPSLNIYGGTIASINAAKGLILKLAGAPQITGLALGQNVVANIDGLLSTARIAVEGELGKVISNVSSNAATVADCFTAGEGLDVAVGSTGALEIVEFSEPSEPGEDPVVPQPSEWNDKVFTTGFNPDANNGYAYCEACYKQAIANGTEDEVAREAAWVHWDEYDGRYYNASSLKESETREHWYLKEKADYTRARYLYVSNGTVCLNLNGFNVTKNTDGGYSTIDVTETGTINIMDSQGTGNVIGGDTRAAARANTLYVEGGTCNLYGGTFKDAARTDGGDFLTRTVIISSDAELNVYEGAVIDGSNVETSTRTTVYVSGTLNLDGGTIIGRKEMTNYSGGSVRILSTGIFNMKSGSVEGGLNTKDGGGNVGIEGGTFNMSGGTVGASTAKHSVRMEGGVLNMTGGTILGRDATAVGTAIGGSREESGVISLGGNATIKSVSDNDEYNANAVYFVDGIQIVINEGWSGKAYVWTGKNWSANGAGQVFAATDIVRGSYANGVVTPANVEYSGKIYLKADLYEIYPSDAHTGAVAYPGASIVTADGTTTWYKDNAAAADAYTSGSESYIRVYVDNSALDLLGKTAYVASQERTITVSNGTLKGFDRLGEDTVTWIEGDDLTIVTDFTEPFDGNRVVVLPVAEGYKSYNLSLALTAVTLRPGTTAENMGMYYKATLTCGPALAARVNTYGAVLSLADMPDANFMTDSQSIASMNNGEDLGITAENNTVVLTTVLLKNIMKQDTTKISANNANSQMPVYANAYLGFDLDNNGIPDMYVMADTENDGKTKDELNESGIAYSLREVVEAIDEYYASNIGENLVSFYNAWADYGMRDWALPNIKAAAAATV